MPAVHAAGGAPGSALADALAAHTDRLLPCVHCGFCLPACPTYTRLGDEADSPRGRIHLMRAVVEGRLDPRSDAFQTHIDRCLGCRACETVCPSGVEYGSLLELARAEAARARKPGLLTRLLLSVFRSSLRTRVAMVASLALRLSGVPSLTMRLLPSGRLRTAAATLVASEPWKRPGARQRKRPPPGPVPSRVSAVEPGRPRRGGGADAVAGEDPDDATPPRVALLDGCVQRWLFAPTHAATTRVLEVNGCQVKRVHGQVCCGALHAHGGDLRRARELARRNVDAFSVAGVDHVIVNAAGCGAQMKSYGHLLADDPQYADRARELASRVRDATEVLAERGPVAGAPVPVAVTYDAPCHLVHAQRVVHPPRVVFGAIPELDLRPLEGEEECCGGAGIYGLTHAELGGRIGVDKARAAMRTGAEVVVTANPGCAMQIGAWLRMEGSKMRVAHVVELLDESYRRAGYYP